MALTYEQAGVSITEGNALVEKIKPLARSTRTEHVLDDVGGFAGLCALPTGIDDPVLVSGTDGVGTKLEVAFKLGRHDTIGIDLVAMCVNDVVTTGADPLFFLDYYVCGSLDSSVAASVIAGIAEGCRMSGCALLGGETAEHPGKHPKGEYDLAGFVVGVASKKALLGPQRVKVGDALIGIASSGLHSNGFSLVRKVIEHAGLDYQERIDGLDAPLGQVLLTPTRIYTGAMRALRQQLGSELHAACHVTGGGITENLPRVLGEGMVAHVTRPPTPAIFRLIAERGPVEQAEMDRTFNMGVGMIVIVDGAAVSKALECLATAGERCFELGTISAGQGAPYVKFA
ncbi:MAG TPA: phosphoribosylformylglycinamidine cyclo-ligase [Polyangiaceae bacterium]|nr:phosphoribosylformylglycinamidine cyclo-ligase [Polyangiaceae bacterium]